MRRDINELQLSQHGDDLLRSRIQEVEAQMAGCLKAVAETIDLIDAGAEKKKKEKEKEEQQQEAAAAEQEPAWLRDAKADYDRTGTIGAVCVLTSTTSHVGWWWKLVACIIAAGQLGLLVGLVTLWVPAHRDTFHEGLQHSHAVIVDGGAIRAAGSSSAFDTRGLGRVTTACLDAPQLWRGADQLGDAEDGAWSCSTYKQNEFCTSEGTYGKGWIDDWGTFPDFADADGVDASQACCVCGGGRNKTVVLTSAAWTKPAGLIGDLSPVVPWEDYLGCRFFSVATAITAAFAGSSNVGTLDSFGWHSAYGLRAGLSWPVMSLRQSTFLGCGRPAFHSYGLDFHSRVEYPYCFAIP